MQQTLYHRYITDCSRIKGSGRKGWGGSVWSSLMRRTVGRDQLWLKMISRREGIKERGDRLEMAVRREADVWKINEKKNGTLARREEWEEDKRGQRECSSKYNQPGVFPLCAQKLMLQHSATEESLVPPDACTNDENCVKESFWGERCYRWDDKQFAAHEVEKAHGARAVCKS